LTLQQANGAVDLAEKTRAEVSAALKNALS
jgi:hypothetical protein